MKSYYRIMLGRQSAYAEECFKGNFIGCDFAIDEDLSKKLPDDWKKFNKQFIPVFLKNVPEKTRIGAGLAMGNLYTIAKGINEGDVVLCPDGEGRYRAAEVVGPYYYKEKDTIPYKVQHRRPVRWFAQAISREDMGEDLKHSTGSIGTVSNITKHATEIEKLLGGQILPAIVATDATIEDPSEFAMEKHLEEFLVENWEQTDLGKKYDIFEENGERVGKQYPTDTGPIDILAVSKDKKELLVVELKKGRASDSVVGQIQRYMGYVQEELAETGQSVRGVIIALKEDNKVKRALAVAPNISFYKYQVSFKLIKV